MRIFKALSTIIRQNLSMLVLVIIFAVAPWFLSAFRLNLLGQFLTYAIIAVGLDLLWGYAGILSLGQGVFFGLGAYCMAMYLKLENSGGKIPDFMEWSGLSHLPMFWQPFHWGPAAVMLAVILPMLLAFIIGRVIFNSRISGVYFSIITQAMALIAVTLLISQQPFTGGTNGLTNFKTIFGAALADSSTQMILYYVTLAGLIAVFILAKWLVNSRFGRILVAIRDSEERVRFCGYNTTGYKLLVFVVAAGVAGLAGALFVPQIGIISPAMVGVVPSIEMVIWVALGGRASLIGPILGALTVNLAKTYFSENYPDIWLYFLGAIFILAVSLLPNGIVGLTEGKGRGKTAIARLKSLQLFIRNQVRGA